MSLKPVHLATNPEIDRYFFTESGAKGRSQEQVGVKKGEVLILPFSLGEEGDDASTGDFGRWWVYAIPSEFL